MSTIWWPGCAEAIAFREACVFCAKSSISKAGIDSDYANVLACGSSDPPWEVANVIIDFKSLRTCECGMWSRGVHPIRSDYFKPSASDSIQCRF